MSDAMYLSEKQAASTLGVHVQTLRNWRRRGAIGHSLTPGGRIRYSTEDLRRFNSAMKVEPTLGKRL